MEISVALCTYNGALFLQTQLDSIAAQTLAPVEVVVCDDGSTDDTLAIVDKFSRKARFPVHLHRNPSQLGSTRNFEKAIRLCRGEAIALCDQDDAWLPSKLATLAAVLERERGLAGVFSNAHLIDAMDAPVLGDLWTRAGFSLRRQRMFAEGEGALALVARDTVTGCTMLFRRSFVPQILPIAPGWIHDGWIALILAAIGELRPVPACTMQYRLHSAQQVGLQQVVWRERLRSRKKAALSTHATIAARFESMADALDALHVAKSAVQAARARARFLRCRIELLTQPPAQRLASALRLLPAYREHAGGWTALLRDMTH